MNNELIIKAKDYGNSFAQCYNCYYKNLTSCTYIFAETLQGFTEALKNTYSQFAVLLYDELLHITDWNEQNILFIKLQLLMPRVVFDNEILNTDKTVLVDHLVKVFDDRMDDRMIDYLFHAAVPSYTLTESARDKIALIDSVQCMSKTLQWFRLDDKYRLRSTLNVLRQQGIIIDSVETVPKYDEVIPLTAIDEDALIITPDEETSKNPITRDGVWFLFSMLRQKGVINQMPDTELSDIVSTLTGYSAEKLRQSKLKTQPAKDKLTSLLEEILSKIKA